MNESLVVLGIGLLMFGLTLVAVGIFWKYLF